MDRSRKHQALLVGALLVAATVFGFDILTSRSIAGGTPYVAVVWLAYGGGQRHWIWIAALTCIGLTILGYAFSPTASPWSGEISLRLVAITVLAITAAGCDVAKRTQQRLQLRERQLQSRAQRQTVELARSRAELDFAHTPSPDEEESAFIRETIPAPGIETFNEFLDGWVQQARNLIGAHQGALSYFPRGNIAEGQHAISLSEKYARYRSYDVLPSGEGIWSVVINEHRSFCLTDAELQAHPAWRNFSEMLDARGLEHPPMRGWLAVPVLSRDHQFVGLLQLSDKYEGEFTDEDLLRLTRLARLMAPSFSLQYAVEELERNYEQLTHAKDALEQSNIELQQFAYIASHDLQTPLRGIAGFAQVLQMDYQGKLDERADDYICRIVAGAKRMHELINDLLAYSRVESRTAPFASTILNEVFDDAVTLLSASIEEAQAVVTRDDLPIVLGDRTQFSLLLQNLLGNAVKYHRDVAPQVHVAAKEDGSQWTISVRDNGIGISAKHHDQVFEIFRRLHTAEKYPGTGIGLAVCRRIVRRHGGEIWVKSVPGEGSTFSFTLPKPVGDDP